MNKGLENSLHNQVSNAIQARNFFDMKGLVHTGSTRLLGSQIGKEKFYAEVNFEGLRPDRV